MKVVKVEDVENKFAEQRKRFDAAHSLAMEKNKYCDQKILIAAQIVKLMVDDVLDDTKGLIIEHSFDTFDNTKSEQKASRFNDYQKDALRTASPESTKADMDNNMIMLVNGVMGLNGESGEVVDIVKKWMFQSKKDTPLDREMIAEELGDVLWYIAVTAKGIGYDLDEIASMNTAKLRKRYPDGFSAERSLNRDKYEK